jgi:hypothetical protein
MMLQKLLKEAPEETCEIQIYKQYDETSTKWLLGNSFMQFYYTIYDLDNLVMAFGTPSTEYSAYDDFDDDDENPEPVPE